MAWVGLHRAGTRVGLAVLAVVTLTASACDERPFTRDDALSVPNSAIQVGEYKDKDWEYVDGEGVAKKLKRCEDTSPWTVEYSCTSPDGTVELKFKSKYGMKNVRLRVGDGDVLALLHQQRSWGDRLRFCMPDSAIPGPTPRHETS